MGRWLNDKNTTVSLPEALFRVIQKNPERVAMDYFGRKITYRELGRWVAAFGLFFELFRKDGITGIGREKDKDFRVALLLPNIPQFVFAYYGAQLAKAVVAPINFSSIAKELKALQPIKSIKVTEEIVAQIADAKPRVLVMADFFWPIVEQVSSELKDTFILVTGPQEFLSFPLNKLYAVKAFKEGKRVQIPERSNISFFEDEIGPWYEDIKEKHKLDNGWWPYSFPNVDDVAQLQYTGGTTGAPKGAMLTYRSVITNCFQCREHLGEIIGQGEVVLGCLPFFHAYGLTACLNITLLVMEGTLILLPSFTPKEAAHLIQKKKITVFPGVNRMFQAMADWPKIKDYDLSSLKLCVSGAGPLHQAVKEKFEKMAGAVLVEGYGLSETSSVVSVTLPTENIPGSVGRPLAQTDVKIVDTETGGNLLPNQDGEIMVRGPQVMKGYYEKSAATSEVLSNGWLRTGDIGYFDEKGFLYITDREKDVIKVLGENVYCRYVEEYLLQHPAVKKCAVIGAPDRKRGEAPIVFAVLQDGQTVEDVQAYAAQVPNKLWVPREIYKVADATFDQWEDILGKVKRRKIKQYYKEKYSKR